MPSSELRILGVPGLKEIVAGDDLGALIVAAVNENRIRVGEGDVFVVSQKVVSKAEGRVLRLDSVEPSALAQEWAAAHQKDPRIVEVVLRESRRIVRMDRGILITETRHGFVCANAGVDVSNTPPGTATLLPEDPDRSAQQLRERFEKAFGVQVAVIVADTFGRPWREGFVNVALGVAGMESLLDCRGQPDSHGRPLQVTVMATADELAAAGELVLGKTSGVPVAIVQGFRAAAAKGSGRDLIRPADQDLFR